MELSELEAKLNYVEEQNKKLDAEKRVLQGKWDAIQRERSALEREYQLRDQKIENLVAEVDNLKSSHNILRLKISRVEKRKYADKETIDKRIAEDEIEIKRLEAEKDGLETEVEACNEQYNQLQQRVRLLEGIAQNYEATIDELKSKQAEQENRINCTQKKSLSLG